MLVGHAGHGALRAQVVAHHLAEHPVAAPVQEFHFGHPQHYGIIDEAHGFGEGIFGPLAAQVERGAEAGHAVGDVHAITAPAGAAAAEPRFLGLGGLLPLADFGAAQLFELVDFYQRFQAAEHDFGGFAFDTDQLAVAFLAEQGHFVAGVQGTGFGPLAGGFGLGRLDVQLLAHEGFELLASLLVDFLIGIAASDFANGRFNLLVGVHQQSLGLLLGGAQGFEAGIFEVLLEVLVLLSGPLEALFLLGGIGRAGFELGFFLFEAFEQVVVTDFIFAHQLGGAFYDFPGQADFAGDFDGKRRARLAYFEAVERLQLLGVVAHGPVHEVRGALGEVLQVGVVGGDDPVHPRFIQLVEHGLGDGPAQAGLGAGAKFINQHQAALAGQQHELLHGQQVRRVGRKVVFQALLVADIQENIFEDAGFGIVGAGNEQAHLQHELHEAHGFQGHGFAARVGAGNDEDALLGVQLQVERYHFAGVAAVALVLGKSQLEQRVTHLLPLQQGLVVQQRQAAIERNRQPRFGPNEVNQPEVGIRLPQIGQVGPQLVGKGRENANQLAVVGVVKVFDVIVQLKNGFRLDKNRLARSRLVVNQALHLALVLGDDRQHQAPAADGRLGVAGNPPLVLCMAQDTGNLLAELALAGNQLLPNLAQQRRSVVAHRAFVVHHLVHGGQQIAVDLHANAQQAQRGVQAGVGIGEESKGLPDGAQTHLHLKKRGYVEKRAGQRRPLEVHLDIVEVRGRKIGPGAQQIGEFVGLLQQLHQLLVPGLELHAGHVLPAQGAQAVGLQLLAQGGEADFLFEVLG